MRRAFVVVVSMGSLLGACSAPAGKTPSRERVVDLAAIIPDRGPDGMRRLPDGTPGSGPLDVSAAAEMFGGGADIERFLGQQGFVRGHMRTWGSVDPIDTFAVKVEEFSDPTGARAYLDSLASAGDRPGVDVTDVEGVPTASIAGPVELPNGEIRIIGTFVEGPRVYTLFFGSQTPSHTVGELARWVQRQARRAA